jgi:Cu/Zn superoxide dismutase
VSIIWLSRDSLKVHYNAGTKVVKHVATMKNYGTAWFNEQGMANILSMSMVKKKFPVRYEIAKSEQFVVSKPEKGSIFAAISNGLHYHETTNCAVVMVTTVRGIEKNSPRGTLENQKRHKDPSA